MSNSEEIKNHRDKIASEGFSKLYSNPIIPYDIHPEVTNNIEAKIISNQVHEQLVEKRKINRIGIVGHSDFTQSTVKFRNEKPCVVVCVGDNGIGAIHAIEMAKKIGADIGTIIAEPLTKNANLSDAILDVMDSRNYLGSTPNKQILEASKLDYERISRMVPKGTKVFNYPDGFSCNARNQKNADRKHKNYLKDKN